MTTEREELIQIIWDGAVADRVKSGARAETVPVVRPKVEAMADAILAAGWRRPRVITTVEELDALPGGSIVAADWATRQKVLGTWVTFGGPGTTTPDLPATVLVEAKPRG